MATAIKLGLALEVLKDTDVNFQISVQSGTAPAKGDGPAAAQDISTPATEPGVKDAPFSTGNYKLFNERFAGFPLNPIPEPRIDTRMHVYFDPDDGEHLGKPHYMVSLSPTVNPETDSPSPPSSGRCVL